MCSGVSAVTTMANSSSRPSLPHHTRRQRLIQDDVGPSIVDRSHHTRGGGGDAIFACSSRQNPASMHANHARGQRWRRGYCGASERATARSHGISPSDAPSGADPGAASHAPSEPPRRRIIRTRRCGRGPDGRHGRRWRDGVDVRASGRKGLGPGKAAAARRRGMGAGVVAGRGRRRQTSPPSRVMLGRIRAGERWWRIRNDAMNEWRRERRETRVVRWGRRRRQQRTSAAGSGSGSGAGGVDAKPRLLERHSGTTP